MMGAVVVGTDVVVMVVVPLTARQAVKYARHIDSLRSLLNQAGQIKHD